MLRQQRAERVYYKEAQRLAWRVVREMQKDSNIHAAAELTLIRNNASSSVSCVCPNEASSWSRLLLL